MSWISFVSKDSYLAILAALGALLVGIVTWWSSRRETGAKKTWAKWTGRILVAASLLLLTPLAGLSVWIDTYDGKSRSLNYLVRTGRIDAACMLARRRSVWREFLYVCKDSGWVDFAPLFHAAVDDWERDRVVEMQASLDLVLALRLAQSVDGERRTRFLNELFKKWDTAEQENIPDDPVAFKDLLAAYREVRSLRQEELQRLADYLARNGKRKVAISLSENMPAYARCDVYRSLAWKGKDPEVARRDWATALDIAMSGVAATEQSARLTGDEISFWMSSFRNAVRLLPKENYDAERKRFVELARFLGPRNRDPLADPLWLNRLAREVYFWEWNQGKRAEEGNEVIRICWKKLISLPASPKRAKILEEWQASLKRPEVARIGIDGSDKLPGPLP